MMRRLVHPLLVVLAFAASALAWPRLPERSPVHWNIAGEVDRYGSRFEAALLMPLVMVLLWGLLRFLPRIDPRRANYAKMQGTYDLVVGMCLATLLVIHGAVLGSALGYRIPMDSVVHATIGVMLIVLGNVLPRARPNWWFGVRTPWTLSNDRVWTRTHRVAGYSMFVAGIALLVAAVVDTTLARVALIAAVMVGAGVPLVYSYFAWRQETSR